MLAHTVTPAGKPGVRAPGSRRTDPLKNLDSGFPMKFHPVMAAKAGIQGVFLDSG
jgi:hypothetical protein